MLFIRDDPKTAAFINFLEFIEETIERSTEDWRIEQRSMMTIPEHTNDLRGLMKFSAYCVMLRFLHGPERVKDLLMDEYSKFAIKRHLWRRLEKIKICELNQLFRTEKAAITLEMNFEGLGAPTDCVRQACAQQRTQIPPAVETAIVVPIQNETENNLCDQQNSYKGRENIECQRAGPSEDSQTFVLEPVPIANEPIPLKNFSARQFLREFDATQVDVQLPENIQRSLQFDEEFDPPCRKRPSRDEELSHQTTASKQTRLSSPRDDLYQTISRTDNFDEELNNDYTGLFNSTPPNLPEENDTAPSSPESPPGYSSDSSSD